MNPAPRRLRKGPQLVDKKFMGPEPDVAKLRSTHESAVVGSTTPEEFEQAITELLKDLGTSHTGCFHERRPRAAGRIAIAATFMKADTPDGPRWVFQDVHPGGVAARAGIPPGDILLTIDDKEIRPPEATPFALGETYTFTIRRPDGATTRPTLSVPGSKEKQRPIVVPDQVVTASKVQDDVALVRVSMFPGVLGMDVARDISRAVADLACRRDLRSAGQHGRRHRLPANHESSLRRSARRRLQRRQDGGKERLREGTAARLRSHSRIEVGRDPAHLPLCARRPIGRRLHRGARAAAAPWPGRPAVQRAFRQRRRDGRRLRLGVRSRHPGRTKTAGRLVATSAFKVGFGYRIVIPVAAYYTWQGTNLEGRGVLPNIEEPLSPQALWDGQDNQLDRALECFQ